MSRISIFPTNGTSLLSHFSILTTNSLICKHLVSKTLYYHPISVILLVQFVSLTNNNCWQVAIGKYQTSIYRRLFFNLLSIAPHTNMNTIIHWPWGPHSPVFQSYVIQKCIYGRFLFHFVIWEIFNLNLKFCF